MRYFILSALNTSSSLLSQIPQITLVLRVRIACRLKLLKDDKDEQDAETPAVTEHYSSFFQCDKCVPWYHPANANICDSMHSFKGEL